jgi:hypothetical protein
MTPYRPATTSVARERASTLADQVQVAVAVNVHVQDHDQVYDDVVRCKGPKCDRRM